MENCLEGDEIAELLADFPLSTKQSSSKKNLFYVQIIYNREFCTKTDPRF